ncbi:BlaI/MecI/CopY family transcriptional regulator [Streptomyces melanosporofaciens]
MSAGWVRDHLAADLAYTTVTTVPARLPAKQAVARRREGRSFLWTPPDTTPRPPSAGGAAQHGGGSAARRLRRALFAHERTHLAARHHHHLPTVQLAACANPFLLPLRSAVAYTAERWADEEAAQVVGSRKAVARAIGKAALASRNTPAATVAAFAAPGPLPRRVTALLCPPPAAHAWPPLFTTVGMALWSATAGAVESGSKAPSLRDPGHPRASQPSGHWTPKKGAWLTVVRSLDVHTLDIGDDLRGCHPVRPYAVSTSEVARATARNRCTPARLTALNRPPPNATPRPRPRSSRCSTPRRRPRRGWRCGSSSSARRSA